MKSLTLYRDKVRAPVTLGLGFEPCNQTDLMDKAFEIQERYGLLTNDSLIAAIALRLEADALVSADARFKGITGLRGYALRAQRQDFGGPFSAPASTADTRPGWPP